MATIIRETTPEHQRAIIRRIVEEVTISGGQRVGILSRAEARPFFEPFGIAVVMAPPDGLGGSESNSFDSLAWFANA
jgi:hypothetical protein